MTDISKGCQDQRISQQDGPSPGVHLYKAFLSRQTLYIQVDFQAWNRDR